MADHKLRIAISGGGLAGAALANALINYPHLDVNIYESASEFSERGAAVGIATNAQKALEAIVPSAKELLDRAGAVSMNSTRLMIGSGRTAGTLVLDLAGQDPGRVVHRAALLRELLAPVPKGALHPNKKLVAIDNNCEEQQSVLLHFRDGSSAVADALIGADGIFGFVRQHILGSNSQASHPASAGWWDCRNLVPIEKAREKLGVELFREPRQYGWIGDKAFLMHDILDDGKVVQCVAAVVEDDMCNERKRELSRESLAAALASWSDGPVTKGMIELLLDQDAPAGYSQYEHKNTPTFARGRVCVAGDAAHAMTPWQGSGAAQAIEDAMVLGALFGSIQSREQIEAALKAYDCVRRPRAETITESSRLTGQIMTGQSVEVDAEALREALASRWMFIHDFDAEKHVSDALMALQDLKT